MAGKGKQFTTAEQERLIKLYTTAENEILSLLNRALLRGNQTDYLESMRANVQKIINQLQEGNKTWCTEAIPGTYVRGVEMANELVHDSGWKFKTIGGFGAIHQQAAQLLAENTYQRLNEVVTVVGRQVDDIYRELALERTRGSIIGYETWDRVARRYRTELADKGVTGFKDRSGKNWNMTTYTRMVARTTTMEAHLEGTKNRLMELDWDLVKVSSHHGACPLCVPWEGKILSLSGKTKGYPTLDEAKADGLFHPNCRHAYGLHIDIDKEIEDMDKEEEKILEEEKYANAPEYVKAIMGIKQDFKEKQKSPGKAMPEVMKAGAILRKELMGTVLSESELRKLRRDASTKLESLKDALTKAVVKTKVTGEHAGKSVEQLLEEIKLAKKELEEAIELFWRPAGRIPQGALLEKLKAFRELGRPHGRLKTHFVDGSDKAVSEHIKEALQVYPTSWIKKSTRYGKLEARSANRGFYRAAVSRGRSTVMAISGGTDKQRNSTAIHELGHRFEDVMPEIVRLEKAFYKKRTKGEDLQWLGGAYDKSEMARFDKFLNPYMGKDYGGWAYELVSMGFEMAYTRPDELIKDEEYADFILGILALFD